MAESNIEWTEKTWNPTTGCNKVSQGCKYCYAEGMALRLQKDGVRKYRNGFDVTVHEYELNTPYRWPEPSLVFVNSMSDVFHEAIPVEFIKRIFKVMNETPQHTYQVLTKRDKRLLEVQEQLKWTKNIWMGVSVEDEKVVRRIDSLRQSKAAVKFLSLEPLIGPLPSLNLEGIDWVIVGGESARTPRPMKQEWVFEILHQCRKADVPFFFKQWGGRNKKAAGRMLNGKIYDEMPVLAKVRQNQ
jgi:protein gp37